MNARRMAFLTVATALLTSRAAHAFLINGVAVSPATPTTLTPVSLNVDMTTPSAPPFLFAPTSLQITDNTIAAELFVDSGPLEVITPFHQTLELGLLTPGTYAYSVVMTPATDVPFGRGMRTASGAFTVIPEPGAMALLVAGAIALRVRNIP